MRKPIRLLIAFVVLIALIMLITVLPSKASKVDGDIEPSDTQPVMEPDDTLSEPESDRVIETDAVTESETEPETIPVTEPPETEPETEPHVHTPIIQGTKEPTCTQDGLTGHTICSECGEVLSPDEVIPAKGHASEVKNYKAATMDAAGYSGDTYCSTCGVLLNKGKEIPRIISNDDAKGKYNWEYTHNALYPLTYKDDTLSIKIDKVWYSHAWCYVAQLEFTDYSRFSCYCANNKYGSTSSTSAAAKQNNAIFATNGDYSAPSVKNSCARRGIVYYGGENKCGSPVLYSSNTGLFGSADMLGVNNMTLNDAVAQGLVTDTFCFGPAFNMERGPNNDGGRAQRTSLGTNGKPGNVVLVVSEGRNVDGVSSGLTYKECADVLVHYGCIYGVPLDGGGSSTMVFRGQILNHVNTERNWIVDFVIVT